MASINRDYARSMICHHVSHFLLNNRMRLAEGLLVCSQGKHLSLIKQLVSEMEKEGVQGHEAARGLFHHLSEVKAIDKSKLDEIERLMQEVMDEIGHD